MKTIKTKTYVDRSSGKYIYNEFTEFLDNNMIFKPSGFNNYIYYWKSDRNTQGFRYPGATRGHIRMDEDNIIVEVLFYEDLDIYVDGIKESVKQFIGRKIDFNGGVDKYGK